MKARCDVKEALASGDTKVLIEARFRINEAKISLGERGSTWWINDIDFNRTLGHHYQPR